MKRSIAYWKWLLADVSLDRSTDVLSLLGFPTAHHAAVRRRLAAAGDIIGLSDSDAQALADSVISPLRRELGNESQAVEQWLQDFPFTDDQSEPALGYWTSHFADILAFDPAPVPAGADPEAWLALRSAFRGVAPSVDTLTESTLSQGAASMQRLQVQTQAIERARQMPMTDHDLEIYLRFGWNDESNSQGLASLELGARNLSTLTFARVAVELFGAAAFELLSGERDLAEWRSLGASQFNADAVGYGATPDEMQADVFPRPLPPPSLLAMLEG